MAMKSLNRLIANKKYYLDYLKKNVNSNPRPQFVDQSFVLTVIYYLGWVLFTFEWGKYNIE